jgi:hypothetical protein
MSKLTRLGAPALAMVLSGCLGSSSSGSVEPTSAATVTQAMITRAMMTHGFRGVRAFDEKPFLQCKALSAPGSDSSGGPGRFGAFGHLDVQPLTVGGQDRTVASLVVVSTPAVAAACAKQLLAVDHQGSYSKTVTDDMIEIPGASPGMPRTQNGVVVDGSYEIIGSERQVMYLGVAMNRDDADAVEHNLRAAAGSFG